MFLAIDSPLYQRGESKQDLLNGYKSISHQCFISIPPVFWEYGNGVKWVKIFKKGLTLS